MKETLTRLCAMSEEQWNLFSKYIIQEAIFQSVLEVILGKVQEKMLFIVKAEFGIFAVLQICHSAVYSESSVNTA